MEISCKRCNPDEVIEVPNFSLDEKEKLWKMNKTSPLHAIKEMRNMHNITLRNAKFVMMHINLEYRKCNRCNSQLNSLEYTSCTKCGALNFNWLI
jgi:hypothetical protein